MPKIRHAVKMIIIRDNKALCIIYRRPELKDYIDLPGGKIEHGETFLETCTRELMEETDLTLKSAHQVGKVINITPRLTYDFEVFVVDDFSGEPHNSEGDIAQWIPIDELRQMPKRFSIAHVYNTDLLTDAQNNRLNVTFECDENNDIISQTNNNS